MNKVRGLGSTPYTPLNLSWSTASGGKEAYLYCKPKYRAILFNNNLVLYSVLFNFGHIRRWDQCAVSILYSKIFTDPGLLKIQPPLSSLCCCGYTVFISNGYTPL